MTKKRTRPTVARMRQLEADNQRLRDQLADAARIGVDTARKLDKAHKEVAAAKAASLRPELETWGLAFSRLGIGMLTRNWPFLEFVVGRDIRLRTHARDALARGMNTILKAMLFWEPIGDGPVDFDVQVPEGAKKPPKTCEAAAKDYAWTAEDHPFVQWVARTT